jgi:hypothetical protein
MTAAAMAALTPALPVALLLQTELPIRAVMNRLEIDVLKLISTEIWGGERGILLDPLTAQVAPGPVPVPVSASRAPVPPRGPLRVVPTT